MPKAEIKLYYKNVMANIIGDEHGISASQFEELADRTSPLISQLNTERKAGKTPYRNLPYKKEIAEHVRKLAAEVKNGCEILVVLGIGGSALGNIALQTALNPYMYNLDKTQRKGPQLFVFDNVDPSQFASFLRLVGDKLDRTIFNVISKTGRTAETASQLMIFSIFSKIGWVLRPHLKMTDSEIINCFTIYATITTMPFYLSRLNHG